MTPEYPVLCVMGDACRGVDYGGPRRTDRAWVCHTCADRTTTRLRAIADMWDDLDAELLAPVMHGGDRAGRQRHGAITQALPYNERAAAARRQAAAHAWFLVRTLYECRPNVRLPDAVDIPTITRWIADWHIPTLVTKPGRWTTTTVVSDTATIHARVRSAAYPNPTLRRAPTGVPCDTPDCPGGYMAVLGAGIATDLICDTDPAHIVPPSEWQRHRWVRTHRPIDLTRIIQGATRP